MLQFQILVVIQLWLGWSNVEAISTHPQIQWTQDTGVLSILVDQPDWYVLLEDSLDSLKSSELVKLKISVPQNEKKWFVFSSFDKGNQVPYRLNVELDSIPDVLDGFVSLQSLDLSMLGLNEIPSTVYELSQLNALNLSFNAIDIQSELPHLCQLKQLREIALYGVKLTPKDIQAIKACLPNTQVWYTRSHFTSGQRP